MKKSMLGFLLFVLVRSLNGQGCSDAGVCSVGGLKPGPADDSSRYSLALNTQYGKGEQNTKILIPQLEIGFKLGKKQSIMLKIPMVYVSGNLGKTNGLGDIILSYSRNIYTKKHLKIGGNAGFRIGVNAADKRQEQIQLANTTRVLPMPYQSSLGTHDLLLGADIRLSSGWLFALGLQVPLLQFNGNSFDTAALLSGESEKKAYFPSANLERRPDLVLRIDKRFELGKGFHLNTGILPIYHLGKDAYTSKGKRIVLEGSEGLTLNVNAGITYEKNRFGISARYASPLVVRNVRPDGLTRHYVYALELKYAF